MQIWVRHGRPVVSPTTRPVNERTETVVPPPLKQPTYDARALLTHWETPLPNHLQLSVPSQRPPTTHPSPINTAVLPRVPHKAGVPGRASALAYMNSTVRLNCGLERKAKAKDTRRCGARYLKRKSLRETPLSVTLPSRFPRLGEAIAPPPTPPPLPFIYYHSISWRRFSFPLIPFRREKRANR
ncbi:hypothetical protein BHM03_00044981 [Ensete ventricosum]|nr:hypothetical protein BHM03_00044981 [Ensete ventricosum]